MRTRFFCGWIVVAWACAACGGPAAELGAAFADVYGSFAPLGVFHRAYADHLFYGTDVAIPEGLEVACEQTGYLMAGMHLSLLSQTGSHVAETLFHLTRARAHLAAFCEDHSAALLAISDMGTPDPSLLKRASELGLFSGIYGVQEGLQQTFEAALHGLENEHQTWSFSVAFALKTLLRQTEPGRVGANLRDILYGSEDALLPPAFVPPDIAEAIADLVELVGSPTEESREEKLRLLAQVIYDYVLSET
jgi:hypothetical protein